MISKNLYYKILVKVLLLLGIALFLGWLIFDHQAYLLAIIPALCICAITVNLINFLNRINRRIFYFFDAIKNEDSTLRFPNNIQNKIINDLNTSLQKVNTQIQQIYLENQKKELYFQALLEHAAIGMFTFNKKGFILHSNKLARHLLEVDVLIHINRLKRIDTQLFQTIKEIQPSEQRLITLHRNSGEIQLLVKSNSFISESDELMLISVHDIKNQLDEKELESWRKLIRVMMHEIMNSITPITSLSEKKVFRVKKLIDNIRFLSSSFDNAENIELNCKVSPPELELHADEKQISQVLMNLVKNAYQANETSKNAKIGIHAVVNEAGHPTISVTDNGPGISDELMDKIFVPFFTTKKKGSGIGLSISRQIMQLHGGSLKIYSQKGKFTSAVLAF